MSGAVVLICAALAVTPALALLARRRLATERRRWASRQNLSEQIRRMTEALALLSGQIGERMLPAVERMARAMHGISAAFPSPSNQQGSNER